MAEEFDSDKDSGFKKADSSEDFPADRETHGGDGAGGISSDSKKDVAFYAEGEDNDIQDNDIPDNDIPESDISESTGTAPRGKKHEKHRSPVVCLGRRWSNAYRIFWGIYWAAVLIVAIVFRNTVVGDVYAEKAAGNVIFWILIAAAAVCAFVCTFVMHPRTMIDEKGKSARRQIMPYHFLLMLAADAWCFFIIEYVNNPDFSIMKWYYMLMNIAGIFIMNMIAFFWLNNLKRSILLIHIVWACMAIVFYIVYADRGEPLQLIDFFSIGTAMTVAGNYAFTMTRAIVVDIVISASLFGIYMHMPDYVLVRKGIVKKILMRVAVFAFMIAMYPFYVNVNWNGGAGILTDLFAPIKTYKEYGTTVGFFCVAKYMRLTPPDGYSVKETEEIAEEAKNNETPNTVSTVKPVNIIAIMNESWADYRYVGDLKTNEEIMPYYDSMKENTIKGHTLVCIRGGGTAKTEYEFLTGNSVKRFPGMVPYVSYFTHDQYSLVTTLEAQGYETAAMHPYKGSNWNRETAYRLLNFDRFYTQDDFDPDVQMYHNHISDQANYEKIIDVINSKKSKDQPFFLFDITMQNHGGYTADDVDETIQVDGYHDDVVSRYLSLEKLSDDALEYLIEYFKDYDEPTLIVMFGDHYPTMPDSFTEYISGKKFDTLSIDEEERYFATPFFIWANYDIPEADNVVTSTNYLGTMMLEQTGLQMADYNYYLKNLMQEIPALNHLGYMDSDGNYHTWSSGSTEDINLEWQYECLQYNNLAEKRNRLDWFFSLDGE